MWPFDVSGPQFLVSYALDRVRCVRISGGKLLPEGRLLDDHLHNPPDPVYELLSRLALTVILERDGSFPKTEELVAQIERARRALARGRSGE